jgi:predicted ATP-grasp superfamily ATP-dependent carboligase
MPRIFVYEFITGGGLLSQAEPPGGSLLREGRAMAAALAEDFAAVPGAQVFLLQDHRLPRFAPPECHVITATTAAEEARVFCDLAARCDWTVVIAPETAATLLSLCRAVLAAGGRLLGPGCDIVQLAVDKQATAEHLRAAGVPAPCGIALEPGERLPRDFPYPAVLKPRDGCGSIGVRKIESVDAAPATVDTPSRLEEYCLGLAASVAVLSGPAGHVVLPPCRQHLSDDGNFTYLGGSLPLPSSLTRRARRLAEQVVATLPPFVGYLGMDLVLGTTADGSRDYVMEINPRLTTSYVGLRAAARESLAAAQLMLAAGQLPNLRFSDYQVEFDAAGNLP